MSKPLETQDNVSSQPAKMDEREASERSRRRGWFPAWLNRDLGLLFTGRGLRSLVQSFLVIIVPLYLARLGFDAIHIGLLFTASAIVSALLTASVGVLADRFGRKLLLVLIPLLMVAGSIFFALSSNFIVLLLAAALGTIGRGGGAGSGGVWGPYIPAEQPLIAEHVSDQQRTTVFGVLAFVGVLTGALGSLLALVPQMLHDQAGYSIVMGYRVLFLFSALVGIAMAISVLPVREHRDPAVAKARRMQAGKRSARAAKRGFMGLSRQSWRLVWRFLVTNTANGLAIGMLGSFVVYWFYRRYGVDANQLGILFFIINLVVALPYLLAGRLARRLGAVMTIVTTRSCAVILLAVMALMPTYYLAAAIYLVRMIANTLANPVRQSYLMGIIPTEERASAAGLTSLPAQIASAFSPSLAGYIMQQISLDLPIELAAGLQAINTILYYVFFHNIHPPEERQREEQPAEQRESDEQDQRRVVEPREASKEK